MTETKYNDTINLIAEFLVDLFQRAEAVEPSSERGVEAYDKVKFGRELVTDRLFIKGEKDYATGVVEEEIQAQRNRNKDETWWFLHSNKMDVL